MTEPDAALQLGPLAINGTVLTTWGVMAGFTVLALLLRLPAHGALARLHNALEAVVLAIESAIGEVLPAASVRRSCRSSPRCGCSCWSPIWSV